MNHDLSNLRSTLRREADLTSNQELIEFWNQTHGHYYSLCAEHLDWNFENQSWVKYELHRLRDVVWLSAVATPEGEHLGIDAQSLWIALWVFRDEPRGEELLQQAFGLAREKRKNRIFVGGDEFHFLPGCPLEERCAHAFEVKLSEQGRQPVVVGDLVGESQSPQLEAYLSQHLPSADKQGLFLRPVERDQAEALFEKRLLAEFPGRWHREFLFWRSRLDTQRGSWFELCSREGRSLGFSRVSVRGKREGWRQDWNPGALRLPLSSDGSFLETDGCLGPIGMWKETRGQGLGGPLLALTLSELRKKAVERICIDWTNAFKYYEPLGFQQVRTYWSLRYQLPFA